MYSVMVGGKGNEVEIRIHTTAREGSGKSWT